MRIFVTGATGFLGRATVKELLTAGHEVLGLARSDSSAEVLKNLGAEVHRGDLQNFKSLEDGARDADAVIHLAFPHDFVENEQRSSVAPSDFNNWCRMDREAIEAMGNVLVGSDKPFITSSGLLLLPQGRVGTEDDLPSTEFPLGQTRGPSETSTMSFASKGIRAMVMRFSPTNYGPEDVGLIPMLINVAKKRGSSAYIGDGSGRWPATHRLDAARALRLAVEKGTAGAVYHPAGEGSVLTKDIAEAIGRKLKIPVVSMEPQEAMEKLGFVGMAFGCDNPVSSEKTRQALGWEPKEITLLQELREGTHYFKTD